MLREKLMSWTLSQRKSRPDSPELFADLKLWDTKPFMRRPDRLRLMLADRSLTTKSSSTRQRQLPQKQQSKKEPPQPKVLRQPSSPARVDCTKLREMIKRRSNNKTSLMSKSLTKMKKIKRKTRRAWWQLTHSDQVKDSLMPISQMSQKALTKNNEELDENRAIDRLLTANKW